MKMQMNRRQVLAFVGGGLVASAGMAFAPAAFASPEKVNAAIAKLFGDRPISDTRVTIDMQEIAENGNLVPCGIEVDSPMTESDYVKTVHVFAEGNPSPKVATFSFSPASGVASAKTRMRLAKTQNIIVVAEMSDGTLVRGTREIKVTIGGCGG